MKLTIEIKHPQITLNLYDGEKVKDKIIWDDQNDLSTKLLVAIDKILKESKIEKESLEKIEVKSDKQSYTSTRIAKTVSKTVNYCLDA